MLKRRSYIPVTIAIIIFILSQVIIVRQVWKQKDEVFKLKYRAVAREATGEMMMKTGDSGFDKAYFVMDGVSGIYMEKTAVLSTPEDSAGFSRKVIQDLTGVLEKDQVLSKYISNAFGRLSLEKKFSYRIIINDLYLLGSDNKYRVQTATKNNVKSNGSKNLILVNNFISEGNHFKISFDYYIDIANKRKVLLREISLTLILSTLSLLILASIFIATLKNYLKEKMMSDLKTDFINNMTHELKTPLSTITVAGKTLKLEEILNDREKILNTASLIGKQSVHLNKLINLILEISMWERSQFQVDRKKTNIEDILLEIGDSFRNGCGSDCTFIEEYNLDGVEAEIDIVYFTMMINNLLHNAVKYSSSNPFVKISAMVEKDIIISVEDNGVGISKADQKRIFDKFFRVSTGNIHSTKGLGLGLYYVKKIGEAHNGTVIVSSKPGKGSVFTIRIPKN